MAGAARTAVIVGGGHNALVAAAYLARAGVRVTVLERLGQVGGAAVSTRPFAGVDVRLSRYSYLVSLLPRRIVDELGLDLRLARRRTSSYTPEPADPSRGILAEGGTLAGDANSIAAWQDFYSMTGRTAARVFPTLTEPLLARGRFRELLDDETAWHALFEAPIAETLEAARMSDTVRGIVLTDALIGTFARAADPTLRQNRCLLYHVIGGGTGDWDVPIGGMGAVTSALTRAAEAAGAELRVRCTVTSITPDGEVFYRDAVTGTEHRLTADHVLADVAPATLDRLLGETPCGDAPEGSQLKVNMVLRRLPRLRDPAVPPEVAFAGTFHVNESYSQLEAAYRQAEAEAVPALPPCEVYCHSLTDPTILGPAERAAGVHTLTLFGLHMPARLFRANNDAARDTALATTLTSLNSVLAEPIEDCLLPDADGAPCIEARTPLDLERELGLPGGHIFHRDLSWPFTEDAVAGRWGVATRHPRILLCGAGARRGGGVSGIPGRNAAMAALHP